MKLSEAIRLGSMLKPQGFYPYVHGEATCALFATAEACGITDSLGGYRLPLYARTAARNLKMASQAIAEQRGLFA